jgi:hypothetical protein
VKELRTPFSVVVATLIMLTGAAQARPSSNGGLTLSRSSINFGNVVVGSSTELVEYIGNPSGSAVTVASASIEGEEFHFANTNFPLTIQSRQQVAVSVLYTPVSAASSSGSLLISEDGTSTLFTVPLYGSGIATAQLVGSPASVNFSAGNIGQKIAETVTNVGGSAVVIQSAATAGSGFTVSSPSLPLILRPGDSAVFNVTSSSSTGAASGTLKLSGVLRWWTAGEKGAYQPPSTSASQTSLTIAVSGSAVLAGQLSASPAAVNFSNTQVGNAQSVPATLTNSGGGPLTITQANASGSGFAVAGLPLPTTLNPGESITFSASFTPTSAGPAQGQIAIVSNASNATFNVGLSGTATAPGTLALSPASLSFGTIAVGKTQSMTATLIASGSSVTVSSASGSSAEFSLSGVQFPLTIPAGQSSSFTVTFAPQSSGVASGSFAFAGSASTATEALNGTGTSPATHNVALSWAAGNSNVTGYNVYRGSQTGGPYAKLNSAVLAGNSYGDGNVTSGQTYFYVTTALDALGAESPHSNEVQAAIP